MTHSNRISPLFTDLYELTMAASYFEHGIFDPAVFSTFIRAPHDGSRRNYYVAAGLEGVLEALEHLHFDSEEIAYLKSTGLFTGAFLDYLKRFRFTGSVAAMPEGAIFFHDEPVLEVTAPMPEAQLAETFILNVLGFQILIATKAARCIHAARGRSLIDFSLRRTQGWDAGNLVARCTRLVGFAATSNVYAAMRYGIPPSGTMAHSYIEAFESEQAAFSAYAKTFPHQSVFLIDTYDTLKGARNAAAVARSMKLKGASLIGVRLDSGDMAALSKEVRKILDREGLQDVKIFASSGFDEFKIARALKEGARIDAFGVGTKMGVSADAPYLDIVYKIVRFADRDVRKLSPGKITLAGKKQVFRQSNGSGHYLEDIIGTREESIGGAETLLETVMEGGRILRPHPELSDIQRHFTRNFRRLDDAYKSLDKEVRFPVGISARLKALQGN